MNLNQNEFYHLVNAYYQAVAYSKKINIRNVNNQPELAQFRQLIANNFPPLNDLIEEGERRGKGGEVEKSIIQTNLMEIYRIPQWFLIKIDGSIIKYSQKDDADIAFYRKMFQKGSNYLCDFVSATIPNLGNHISLKEGVDKIVNSILNENYWEGEDLIQIIDIIRKLKTDLYFSDEWLKEYTFKICVE